MLRMRIGKPLEAVESIDAPVQSQFFRRLVKKFNPPALEDPKLHDVAFNLFVAKLRKEFCGVFAFEQRQGIVSAQSPFGVLGPTRGDANSWSGHMLAKNGTAPLVIGDRTVPGSGRLRTRKG